MIEKMKSFFSQEFMPHGHCYLWKPEILWINAISDGLIFLAYLAIPIILAYIVFKSDYKIPFNHLIVLFSIFILSCGASHLMEVINIWESKYILSSIIKAITAIVSILTAISLVYHIPKVVNLIRSNNSDAL